MRMSPSPIALVAALAVVAACSDAPTTPAKAPLAGSSKLLGNGFPEGGHDYRLNIIGVPKDKTASMDNNNGRRIDIRSVRGWLLRSRADCGRSRWRPSCRRRSASSGARRCRLD